MESIIGNLQNPTTTPIDVDYDSIVALVAGASLKPGQTYRLNNFRTRHEIPNSDFGAGNAINEGPIEVLILTAISNDTLSPWVISESYSQDRICYELVCTHKFDYAPIVGADRGWIYYREDTLQNNKVNYDFRNVMWRRYLEISNSTSFNIFQSGGMGNFPLQGTWSVLTTNPINYEYNSVGNQTIEIGAANFPAGFVFPYMASSPDRDLPFKMRLSNCAGLACDGIYTVVNVVDNGGLSWTLTVSEAIDFTGLLDANTEFFKDFPTFVDYSSACASNDFYGPGEKPYNNDPTAPGESYNNVFFGSVAHNKHWGRMHDNTFFGSCLQNDFGAHFNNNIIGSNFFFNRIIDAFNRCLTGLDIDGCVIHEDASSVIFEGNNIDITIGQSCSGLFVADGAGNIKLASGNINIQIALPNLVNCIIEKANVGTGVIFTESNTLIGLQSSNYKAVYNISGLTAITVIAPDSNCAGILNIESNNAAENVSSIIGLASDYDIEIRPVSGLVLTLTGTAFAAIAANNKILMDAATIILDGSKNEFAVFRRDTITNGNGTFTVMKLVKKPFAYA